MKTISSLSISIPILFGAAWFGLLAVPVPAEAAPVMVQLEGRNTKAREFNPNDLRWISRINFKNDDGTRKGFIVRNSETKDDEGNPVKGWSIVMNEKIFAETLETGREKASILLKQENSTEEYLLDLNTGKILNRNKDRKDWAEILEMTLALLKA